MSYVDGFVIPVRTDRKAAFIEMAARLAPVFKEYGATQVVECWGDDVPDGKVTDFKGAVQATPDETVVFAWIVYPSKAVRDTANAKIMADPRLRPEGDAPFDGKRTIFGGFDVVVDVA